MPTVFLPAFSRASFASLSLRPNSGSASSTCSPSRFVTKPVCTAAPLAYVMLQSHTMWSVLMTLALPDRHVSDGANRKNFMPRSK